MQLQTSALIPTIVIISLLAFFIGLAIAVAYHRFRKHQIRQIRRERRQLRSSQSVKKLTIEKGRVVTHSEDTSPITPQARTFPRHGFWSVRTVPKSSSLSASSDFSSWGGGLDVEKQGATYHRDHQARPNIDSVFDGNDMAEKGLFKSLNGVSDTTKRTFLTVPLPSHTHDNRQSLLASDQSPNIRIDSNGYANGVRVVPLTTQSSPPSPTASRRPRTPSGMGTSARASAVTSMVGLPTFRIPTLDRRQAIVFPEPASIDEVMDCLENAPRRSSRLGLLRGPLATKPAFSLTVSSPKMDQNSEKALPDLPHFDAQPSPPITTRIISRKAVSPRASERAKSMLVTIPGSPPESPSRCIASDGDDLSTIASSPRRPMSYSGSQKSRLSTILTHHLSLASLGPDFSGFRKSIAPSITGTESRPTSPVRSINPASPTKPTLLIPEDSAPSAQSSPILPRDFPDVPPRGLSTISARSFGTLSSVSTGEVYNLARAMPVVHSGPATPTSVPISPASPVSPINSSPSTTAIDTSQADLSASSASLPPPIPPRAYRPAPPANHRLSQPAAGTGPRNSFLVGKRKELINPSRRARPPTRKVTPPLPSPLIISGSEKERTNSTRLLKTPLSPMSIRTAEALQKERGKSWSGSEWEGNDSLRSGVEGRGFSGRSRDNSPAVFL